MIENEKAKCKILPVASGKGGVGKSLLTANLGLRLAHAGKKTVVVDLDLGGSNLHTYLGYRNTHRGIGNFLSDPKTKFQEILVQSHIAELRYVPGDVLVSGLATPSPAVRRKITRAIEEIDADIVLVDLGSGTSPLVIEMFLLSNSGIVVSTPQAPSALNAYSLLKNVLFRRLQESFAKSKRVSAYLKDVQKDSKPGTTPTLADIVKGIQKIDKKSGTKARNLVNQLKPHLVLNMAHGADDLRIAESLRALTSRNLGIDLGCLGVVFSDPQCNAAVSALKPVTEFAPESVATWQIDRIAQKIAQSDKFPEMPLDLEEYKDSFELAGIELAMDIDSFGTDPAATAQPAAEDNEQRDQEFLEVIAQQRHEIDELKGTIRNLTTGQGPQSNY